MREILFRGKCVDNGEWVEGFFVNSADIYLPSEAIVPFIIEPDSTYFGYGEFTGVNRVIPESVSEFTGLTDKNGKKIFEGDIFLIDDEYHAVVIFEDGCFRLQVHGLCGTYTEGGYCEDGGGYGIIECDPIDWFFVHDMKIVGNIHDNPELLKEGAE